MSLSMLWGGVGRNKRIDRSHKIWTKDEEKYLIDNYNKCGHKEIARHLNRTEGSVIGKSHRLRQIRDDMVAPNHWSEAEEQYLIDNYRFKRNDDLAKELGRTVRAVSEKANRIGLRKVSMKPDRKKSWDRVRKIWCGDEERFISDNHGSMEVVEIAFHLNRSVNSVRSKIKNMGLK